jgi:hypothetical protein
VKTRSIILHYHIFKNAGSTIQWILEKNFHKSFSTLHETDIEGVVSNDEIILFAQEHPEIVALASHHFRLPSPSAPSLKFIELCLFRHPLDRIQSMYYYFRKLDNLADPYVEQAHKAGLAGFVEWSLEAQPYNVVNSQTCFCSTGGAYYFPPSSSHLKRAKSTLKNIKILGVVDRFDESLVVAEFFLRFIYRDLDLSYVRQNSANPSRLDLPERLNDMKIQCGDALFGEITRLNKFDEELWQCASQELDRRISHIPRFEQKLQSFRKRCEIW